MSNVVSMLLPEFFQLFCFLFALFAVDVENTVDEAEDLVSDIQDDLAQLAHIVYNLQAENAQLLERVAVLETTVIALETATNANIQGRVECQELFSSMIFECSTTKIIIIDVLNATHAIFGWGKRCISSSFEIVVALEDDLDSQQIHISDLTEEEELHDIRITELKENVTLFDAAISNVKAAIVCM